MAKEKELEIRNALDKNLWMTVAAAGEGPESLKSYLKNGPSDSVRLLRQGCVILNDTKDLKLAQSAQKEMFQVITTLGLAGDELTGYLQSADNLPRSELIYLAQNGAYSNIKKNISPEYLAIYQEDQEILDEFLSWLPRDEWDKFLLSYNCTFLQTSAA